jgi:hypothetical protein
MKKKYIRVYAKDSALYSRLLTKISENVVAAPFREGLEKMFSRGGKRRSEGEKVVAEAKQRAANLEVQVEQLRRRVNRA